MNLDELQSVRDRERQSDSLQQLRETFYEDAGAFVQQLREERSAAADRADDPFDAPEVNRLTDDIKTAEQTVEAIYERRVGKLVKMASFAAADMPTEDEGLTAEERELFEQLVAAIEGNRDQVFAILDGDDVPASSEPATETTATADADVDAADLMGTPDTTAGVSESDSHPPAPETSAEPLAETPSEGGPADGVDQSAETDPSGTADHAPDESTDSGETPDTSPDRVHSEAQAITDPSADAEPDVIVGDTASSEQASTTDTTPEAPVPGDGANQRSTDGGHTEPSATESGQESVERETVRITQDVGAILGVDQREYDLSQEDVVTLPADNVSPLVERDAAERLD